MTITLFDVTARPKAPRIAGVTAQQLRQGQRLSFIHALHLREIAQVEGLIEQIEATEVGTQIDMDQLNDALQKTRCIRLVRRWRYALLNSSPLNPLQNSRCH